MALSVGLYTVSN